MVNGASCDTLVHMSHQDGLPTYDEVFNLTRHGLQQQSTGNQQLKTQPQTEALVTLPTYDEISNKRDRRPDEIFVIFDYDEKTVENKLHSAVDVYTNSLENTVDQGRNGRRSSNSRVKENEGISCCAKWLLVLTISCIVVLMIIC